MQTTILKGTPGRPRARRAPPCHAAPAARASQRKPSEVGNEELIEALRRHDWQPRPAAIELGITQASIYALIDECPIIRKASELERDEIESALASSNVVEAARQLEVSKLGLQRRMRALGISRSP